MTYSTHEEVFGESDKQLFTLHEAAQYLEIDYDWMWELFDKGSIRGRVYFKVEDLRQFKKEDEK